MQYQTFGLDDHDFALQTVFSINHFSVFFLKVNFWHREEGIKKPLIYTKKRQS